MRLNVFLSGNPRDIPVVMDLTTIDELVALIVNNRPRQLIVIYPEDETIPMLIIETPNGRAL